MPQIIKQGINKILHIDQKRLEAGEAFPVENFTLNQRGLFLRTMNKETGEVSAFKISEPLFIKDTVQNLDTKEVQLTLCYKYKDKYQDIQISMGQLIPNELLKLSSKGVNVTHEQFKAVASFLQEQQKFAPHKEIYREVGWHEDEQKNLLFRHHQVYPINSMPKASNDMDNGLYNLKPDGELVHFKEMVTKEVLGNTPLETMMCVGFSAALVGYLSKKYDDVDTLLIHLVGDSTQGKTTAALLAVSPFGMPSSNTNGLMKTWNGTTNATINQLAGNYGIPLVLDELSMSNSKSLTSELYVLTNGQEKSRLNDEMKQRKQGTWATTLISTGEQSIFERTNQNVGLTVRAFEFSHVCWTASAQNADEIRSVIQDNYGQAGQGFIQYLFEQGLSIIDEKWLYWQERCVEVLPESPFRARIAKKYAIILAAGDLAKQALGIGFHVERVLDFFVSHEADRMLARDIGGKAFSYVTQLVIQHQANFRKERDLHIPINCWGKIFFHPDGVEVAFLKNVLEQQLKIGGFDDPKVVIRDWKEKGFLITEGDRTTKRTKIFETTEQEERKKVHGEQAIPKKLQDTTYNIKFPLEIVEGLIQTLEPSYQVAETAKHFTFK